MLVGWGIFCRIWFWVDGQAGPCVGVAWHFWCWLGLALLVVHGDRVSVEFLVFYLLKYMLFCLCCTNYFIRS